MLDKERRLRFGMGAMIEVEKSTGKKLADLGSEMSMEMLAKIFWIILKQDDEKLTFKDTIRLIDDHLGVNDVLLLITEVMNDAFGKADPNAETTEQENI